MINSERVISAMTMIATHVDECESLWDLLTGIEGRIIADKGLLDANYQDELRQYTGIDLQTAVRNNMEETRRHDFIRWIKSTQCLVR